MFTKELCQMSKTKSLERRDKEGKQALALAKQHIKGSEWQPVLAVAELIEESWKASLHARGEFIARALTLLLRFNDVGGEDELWKLAKKRKVKLKKTSHISIVIIRTCTKMGRSSASRYSQAIRGAIALSHTPDAIPGLFESGALTLEKLTAAYKRTFGMRDTDFSGSDPYFDISSGSEGDKNSDSHDNSHDEAELSQSDSTSSKVGPQIEVEDDEWAVVRRERGVALALVRIRGRSRAKIYKITVEKGRGARIYKRWFKKNAVA
jgi:hypothetical protein